MGSGFQEPREAELRRILDGFLGVIPLTIRWLDRIPLTSQGKLIQTTREPAPSVQPRGFIMTPVKVLHVFGRMQHGGAEMRTVDVMRQHRPRTILVPLRDIEWVARRTGRPDLRAWWRNSPCEAGAGFPLEVPPPALGAPIRRGALPRALSERFFTSDGGWGEGSGTHRSFPEHGGRPGGLVTASAAAKDSQALDRPICDTYFGCERGGDGSDLGTGLGARPTRQTVYNGLDLAAYHGPPDPDGVRREFNVPAGSVLCTHVGRFSPPKNHRRLLAIFAQVLRHTPASYLVLVGSGTPDAESPIRARASELGLADRLVFAGVRDDVPRLLLAADLMIFPSIWEGLPGAVLEACAAGLPVLASDLPGVQEIARFFPGVACVSLEESDQVWSDRALQLLASGGGPPGRSSRPRVSICSVAFFHRASREGL